MTVSSLDSLADVTLDLAWRIGFRNEGVAFSARAEARISECRDAFERLLAGGDAGFVYGSTAAPGARAKTPLSEEAREFLARSQHLWAPHEFGGGSRWVPAPAVRLIVLARLTSYLEGHGRVTMETARRIAGLLDADAPSIPLDCATGPGEVMPLSWLYSPLGDLPLAPGELMALYNGSPCASGFAAYAALTAGRRLALAERIFALAVEAVAAPLDPYDAGLEALTADPDHRALLHRMREDLDEVPRSGRLPHQAPVSWRIVPGVLAAAARAVRGAREVAAQSLQSAAHNPVFLPPDAHHPDGRVLSPGGFHNHAAARAIDALNVAGADICALATKQTARLLDGAPFGLPRLLVPEGSGVIGTEFLAWSQTAHAERARLAAAPSVLTIGLEDPGGGQSDVASPVFLAFERFLDIADCVDASLATFAIALVQGYRLSGRSAPPRLAGLHARLADAVPAFDQPAVRALGAALRRLKASFSDAVLGRGDIAPHL